MKKRVLILCGLLLMMAACAARPEPTPGTEPPSAAPAAPQSSEALQAEPLPIVSRPLATAGEAYFRIEESGRLVMWGYPDYGTLSAPESDPLSLLEDAVCVSVSPTSLPAMAIDRNGTLWGLCAPELYTALNPGADLSDPMRPVRLMEDVADVCCGQWASAILKRDGTLYIYGSGPFCLPGQESSNGPATLTEVMSQVRAAAVSGLSAYAVGQDGSLWRWRDGSEAIKLLEGDFVQVSPSGAVLCADGTLMRDTGEVILTEAAEVGDTFAIRRDGSLWVWGEWWQSWFPDLTDESLTRPVQALDGIRAAAVCHGCLLLRTDGEITVLPQPVPTGR